LPSSSAPAFPDLAPEAGGLLPVPGRDARETPSGPRRRVVLPGGPSPARDAGLDRPGRPGREPARREAAPDRRGRDGRKDELFRKAGPKFQRP
jgi:hypothetical protein